MSRKDSMVLAVPVLVMFSVICISVRDCDAQKLHKRIISTIFWVGEKSGPENEYIPNDVSAWDGYWMDHFGGIDDPDNRNGYFPAGFTPKENPFYFALPYNDIGDDGERKPGALDLIPWARCKSYTETESACKNRWVRIVKDGVEAYAQWEDVGPFYEDDADYVFGWCRPKNKHGAGAGIDVSPAVADYLGLEGIDEVDWEFVDFEEVPEGPWKLIVTKSQIEWAEGAKKSMRR